MAKRTLSEMTELSRIVASVHRNKDAVYESPIVGCFYCLSTFPPNEIREWTASAVFCPECDNCCVVDGRHIYKLNKLKEYFHDT